MTTKPCIKCGAVDRNKRGDCRPCSRAAVIKWQVANSEKEKLRAAKWRKNNIEKARAATANWQKAHPEKARAATAIWMKANPERIRATAAEWRKANPNAAAIWRKSHHEKVRATAANWIKNHPERRRIYGLNRRAREQSNGSRLSPDLAKTLYKRQKGKCICCKEPLGKDFHLDHIMPLALGGKNEDWNMQLLTARCNLQKQAKHPVKYMQERGFLI